VSTCLTSRYVYEALRATSAFYLCFLAIQGEIKATAFNAEVDRLHSMLQENKVRTYIFLLRAMDIAIDSMVFRHITFQKLEYLWRKSSFPT
jgi:hypothetical protein